MVDKQKLNKLADIIVNYSVAVKKGEKVLIAGYGFDGYPLIKKLYRECIKAGALLVEVRFRHDEMSRLFFEHANKKQLEYKHDLDEKNADKYDCMIQVVADGNPYELEGVPIEKINVRQKAMKPVSDILHKKRWLLFYYPNQSFAHVAKKSVDSWEDFVLDSCIKDWKKEEKKQKKFIELMKKVDEVHVTGTETDLKYSVKGQKWRTCCGRCNLPDGEIFTSPRLKSVNGTIKFNVPTHYMSKDFDWIKLTFKDGKIIDEKASHNTAGLTKILNTDKGSRYVGEAAFGLNDSIKEATRLILFDEKMGKSMHMAMGKCYEDAPNGNDSSVHWDMIFNFKWAKAEIFFDGKKVFSKTKWVDPRFKFLN